jgi:hypothetical protein
MDEQIVDKSWTTSLTDEQKAEVWEFIVYTVKEIRNDIAIDILATSDLWKSQGLNKSRRTQKAFDICAAIAWGKHELEHHGLNKQDDSQ